MANQIDSVKALGEIPALHAGRLRFYAEADRSIIDTIQLGVLFFMAWWSGPARQCFAHLKKALEKLDSNGRIEIVVVDIDGCPDLCEISTFNHEFTGAGEIAWVRNGQVIRFIGLGRREELLEPFTKELLALTEFT